MLLWFSSCEVFTSTEAMEYSNHEQDIIRQSFSEGLNRLCAESPCARFRPKQILLVFVEYCEGFASSIGKCLRYRKLHLDEGIFTSWIRAWNLGVSVSAWCPSSSGPHPEAGCHPLAATAAHGTESTGWACTTDLAQHWEKTNLFFLAAGGRRTYAVYFFVFSISSFLDIRLKMTQVWPAQFLKSFKERLEQTWKATRQNWKHKYVSNGSTSTKRGKNWDWSVVVFLPACLFLCNG